jgi:hypothetical protein
MWPWALRLGRMAAAAAVPLSGEIPFAVGAASYIRIPVPGTKGLCIELGGRGWTPKSGSTSTLFIQDALGKKNLRLDYGYNVKTGTINYHWNQKGTYQIFGIADHTVVGSAGRVAYKSARYFRYAGRVLAVVGMAVDVYSVVVSPPVGRGRGLVARSWARGARGWAPRSPPGLGTPIGGVAGCIAGAFISYEGASRAAGRLYDWADATFTRVPETASP